MTEGERDAFVPVAIKRTGNLTQVSPDVLRFRVWTGYFFFSVPVRIYWPESKLALGQRCLYQAGRGFGEGGCEVNVDGVRIAPRHIGALPIPPTSTVTRKNA